MATYAGQVGASADDAFENSIGTTSINGTTINVDEDDEWGFWRWTGLSALDGATIIYTLCQFYFTSTTGDEPEVTFWGHDVDNAPAATAGTTNLNISGRVHTTASVVWSNPNMGLIEPKFAEMPSLVAILQELADSGHLASGVFALLCTSTLGDANRDLLSETYDGNPAHAAVIDVTYTPAGGALQRTLAESLGCADAGGGMPRREIAWGRVPVEMLAGAANPLERIVEWRRQSSETLALLELAGRTADADRTLTESLDLAALRRIDLAAQRVLQSVLSLADVETSQASLGRALAELLLLEESVAVGALHRLQVTDAAGLAESASREATAFLRRAEELGLSAAAFRAVDALRALFDALAVADLATRRRILGNILPGDAAVGSRGAARTRFSSLGPGDARTESGGPGDAAIDPQSSNE